MDNIKSIERKWQKYWKDSHTFEAKEDNSKEKFYYLIEFPYPSGSGLHVGHVRSYTALDAMARKKRMMGYNVLFPIGWDAFGAPAEQYAIKNYIHPKQAVEENIKTFKGQIEELGISFDWSREFSTTDPSYYKWTQWQFIQFFKHGLAYKAEKNINWCPTCKTGLSNEDSSGGVCERCGSTVIQKEKEQWMLKMSSYAEDLIKGLDDTNFQEKIKTAQINWIGKSTGAEVEFKLKQADEKLTVYTTRPDTLYGVTFMVIAPEHPYVDLYSGLITNMNEVIDYRESANKKTEFERTQLAKDKTGIKLEGLTAINPITNEEIPVYISDYVMMNYGTGAIMAVPAHDERDYDFAKKFGIEIKQVIAPFNKEEGEDAPRDGAENTKRNLMTVIIKHHTEDKYLCINWKETGWKSFVGGGVEEGESMSDTALREAKEESGYQNIVIDSINRFYFVDNFYAKHKGVNREINAYFAYAHILDDNQTALSDEENNLHELVWIDKKEVLNYLNKPNKSMLEWVLFEEKPWTEDGIMINSGILNGMTNKKDSIDAMLKYIEEKEIGRRKTNYKLQDWIFTRQRFWGEPIPLVNCELCGWVPVRESDLPVVLPDVVEYEPTDDGESPLARIEEFVNTTCPECGRPAKRETDTMPNWAGSSWYWLRYMDPHNDKEFVSPDALKYWGQVDWYNGGMEHATRHLLYARFWNQFLHNIGLVPNSEPFSIRAAHGMILGEGGVKMSKSLGNVINPDDMVKIYGADALRCYEMFIGDYEKEAAWSEQGLIGCRRFLDKVIRIGEKLNNSEEYSKEVEKDIHKTIKKVSDDLDASKFNTAISALMIILNRMEKMDSISKKDYRTLLTLLNPVAPHITEELNEEYKLGSALCESSWPKYEESMLIDEEKEIAVQVNGKVRATITVNINDDDKTIEEKALNEENVKNHTCCKEIVKIIVIKGKIVNIVVK